MKTYTVDELRDFELSVIESYEAGKIRGPVHLSHGNETALIEIFKEIKETDWVFSTWRNHYHALLKGIPQEWLMNEILQARSINISNGDYKFHTSAIVCGTLPIATGVAAALKMQNKNDHVWCFIGDMAATSGMFKDCVNYVVVNDLPLTFVIEDNGYSTNSPTKECFHMENKILHDDENTPHEVVKKWSEHYYYYKYQRKYPHVGIGKFIYF